MPTYLDYFLGRGIVPKLLRQHILPTLILRVSDPGAPSNKQKKKKTDVASWKLKASVLQKISSKKWKDQNSRVVQWLGFWAFTAMDLNSIPGWGTKIPQALWLGGKKKWKDNPQVGKNICKSISDKRGLPWWLRR